MHAITPAGIERAPLAAFDDLPPFSAIAFLPGGEVAAGALDGRIAVVAAGRAVVLVRAFASSIDWLASLPSGRLAVAGDDRTLRVAPAGEALLAGEVLVAEENGRRFVWPRAKQGRVRIYDAAALARGEAVIVAEHAAPARR